MTNKELNIKELLAELEVYRWRDKKAAILKELRLNDYFSKYKRDVIKNAYEANRPFTLIELLHLNKGADDLLSKGYAVDEIIRAVREWVKECLDEIESKMSNNTIFRLKKHVTIGDLEGVGFQVNINGATKVLKNGFEVYIPLKKRSVFGYRIIQDNQRGVKNEELDPKYIEDLIERGWVDEIEKEKE